MKRKLVVIVNIVLMIFLNFNIVFAETDLHTAIYGINNNNGVFKAGAIVAGYIKYFAIVIAVIVLMYLGIKFIIAAPEGKAEVKKQLIVAFIGIVILFVIVAVFNWIQTLTGSINKITGP